MSEVITELSQDEAAALLLDYHHLSHPQSLKGKKSILSYIKKVGCIQFDPLNVCGRNPDLVLQSRIKDYKQEWLRDSLYKDRALIEGWDKMMAISNVHDWLLLDRLRQETSASYFRRYPDLKDHLPFYLEEIRKNGPLSSRDFKNESINEQNKDSKGQAKKALEGLYFQGKLSIHHRETSRRVFDLTERLLPKSILNRPKLFTSEADYQKAHILRRIASAGIAGFSFPDFWFGIANCPIKCIRRHVGELVDDGLISRISIQDSPREWYVPYDVLDNFLSIQHKKTYGHKAVLLGALDNMMWNRDLLEDIFDFKYRWEVYTPPAKREYGYYVLPILYRGKLIARCEPYLERKTKTLLLKGFWLQEGFELNEKTIKALRLMFSQFCRFLEAETLIISDAVSPDYQSCFEGISSSKE